MSQIRTPVGVCMGVTGFVVVCDDGMVFTLAQVKDNAPKEWVHYPPIPGTLAARAQEDR